MPGSGAGKAAVTGLRVLREGCADRAFRSYEIFSHSCFPSGYPWENESPKLLVCKHNQHSKKSKNVVTQQVAITLLVSIQKFWYAPASQATAAARDRRHAG